MLSQQLRMRLLQYLHLCRQSHTASRHLCWIYKNWNDSLYVCKSTHIYNHIYTQTCSHVWFEIWLHFIYTHPWWSWKLKPEDKKLSPKISQSICRSIDKSKTPVIQKLFKVLRLMDIISNIIMCLLKLF